METVYAYPKCTYLELRDSRGEHVYTICSNKLKAGAPLAIENYTPMPEEYARALRVLFKYEHGRISKEQAEMAGVITNMAQGAAYKDSKGGFWRLPELMEMAKTRVYLTADGYNMIASLSGGSIAYIVSGKDLYVLSPNIRIAENVKVEPEPEPVTPDPVPLPKRETSKLNKLLLLIAGWVLFN